MTSKIMVGKTDVRVSTSSSTGFLQTPAITIVVGDGEARKEYSIHEGILCNHSEFFVKALKGEWLESHEGVIRLPEDEPAIFSAYQDLLYTDVLPVKRWVDKGSKSPDMDEDLLIAEEFTVLSKLYVLAEKLIDEGTQAVVLDAFYARVQECGKSGGVYYPAMDCVQIIYEGTPSTSRARSMLVTFYTKNGDQSFLTEDVTNVPKDFLYDLAQSMLANLPAQRSVDSQMRQLKIEHSKVLKEKDRALEQKYNALRNKSDKILKLESHWRTIESIEAQLQTESTEVQRLRKQVRDGQNAIKALRAEMRSKNTSIELTEAELERLRRPAQSSPIPRPAATHNSRATQTTLNS